MVQESVIKTNYNSNELVSAELLEYNLVAKGFWDRPELCVLYIISKSYATSFFLCFKLGFVFLENLSKNAFY